MTTTTCTHCLDKPTTASLCRDCRLLLEGALTMLASWHEAPPGVHTDTATPANMPEALTGDYLPPTVLTNQQVGALPSSAFDAPSSRASRGGTKSLALELDVMRSRQARLGTMNGPRLAPGSKIHWPYEGGTGRKPLRRSRIDDVEHGLVEAVRTWIARLHKVDVSAPRSVTTGHVLARGCTWLLWHVNDIATHPLAAEAVSAFEDASKQLQRLVDRKEARVYAGPCWHVEDVGYCTIEDRVEYVAELKCPADMYMLPRSVAVECRACAFVHAAEDRLDWFRGEVQGWLASAPEIVNALCQFGLEDVTSNHVAKWAERGLIVSAGRRPMGPKRTVPLYRVGDVLEFALKREQDPRVVRRRAVSA